MSRLKTYTQKGGFIRDHFKAQVTDGSRWGSSGPRNTKSEAVREAVQDLAYKKLTE